MKYIERIENKRKKDRMDKDKNGLLTPSFEY